MPVTVQAVFLYDDFWEQATSTLTASSLYGEIEPASVAGLVNETKSKIGSDTIATLEIFAHGTDTYIHAGTDMLHSYTPKTHMPTLAQLRGHFDSGGSVVLYVCKAGRCANVLSEMAKTLGVNVYATEGDVRPMLYGTRYVVGGALVVAHPDGSLETGDGVHNPYYYETEAYDY